MALGHCQAINTEEKIMRTSVAELPAVEMTECAEGGNTAALLETFDRHVKTPVTANLGGVVERNDIQSSIESFHIMPKYRVSYPEVVVQALGRLYAEYNQAFIPALEKNREWASDYKHCMQSGLPVNFAVQIDMVGLPESFLQAAEHMSVEEVVEIFRRRTFEIENSLAMYQLLEVCCSNGTDSFFKKRFRPVLSKVRKRHGKKVALLAVTQQKYDAMLHSEFGKQPGDAITDDEVRALSGFDRFFGPDSFRQYLAENGGKCGYLLYVRSSDPVSKLKDPSTEVDHPLLSDPSMRKLIKANAVTFNVDAPTMDHGRRINDTKEYQSRIGMAFAIDCEDDLFTLEFSTHLYGGNAYADFSGPRLSKAFVAYLEEQGIDPADVESGKQALRFKPSKLAYGCYGHVTGVLTDQKVRGELRRQMRQRGAYVVQPEFPTPKITNVDGATYAYIDRNFMAFIGGKPQFIGGFRSMMPIGCHELKKGRNHGNGSTVWAEIVTDQP